MFIGSNYIQVTRHILLEKPPNNQSLLVLSQVQISGNIAMAKLFPSRVRKYASGLSSHLGALLK